MNRRQLLYGSLAAGAYAGLELHNIHAQQQPVTFDDISLDPQVQTGQQASLAALVNFCRTSPPGSAVDPSLVTSAIDWSQLWTNDVIQSGLADRTDQMLSGGDPNSLTGAVPSGDYVQSLHDSLYSQGVYWDTGDIAGMLASQSFPDATAANQDFGGFGNGLNYFANGTLPLLYPPDVTGSLAQARRARALRWKATRIRMMGARKDGGPAPLNYDCNGANKAISILTTVTLGLGVATAFGCIPCGVIGVSHALPLMILHVTKVIYCP